MNSLYLRLLIVFSFIVIASSAQKLKFQVTDKFKIKDDGSGYFLKFGDTYLRYDIDYGHAQLGYIAKLKKVHYGISLFRYDANMQEVQKFSLDNEQKQLGPFRPYLIAFGNKLDIIYYKYMDDEDAVKMFVTQVDPNNLSIIKTIELFKYDQKNVGLFKMESVYDKNNVFVVASPSEEHVLIMQSNTAEVHSFIVDEDLSILKNSVFAVPSLKDLKWNSAFLDNEDNKYFSYEYKQDKDVLAGTVTDNNKDEPKPQPFKLNEGNFIPANIAFAGSQDGKHIYLYGNYRGNFNADYANKGVFLATVDNSALAINTPTLFAYPDDIKARSENMDFGYKKKGDIFLKDINYSLHQLNDETVALTGFLFYQSYVSTMKGTFATPHAGPIVAAFITSGKKAAFTIIPRDYSDEAASAPADIIPLVYHDKLVCLYADKEKNINNDFEKNPSGVKGGEDMSLAAAVFNKDGNLLSRSIIADKPGDNNYFILDGAVKLRDKLYMIPIGREKIGWGRPYFQYEKLGTLEIN